jgi:hypothetical protein
MKKRHIILLTVLVTLVIQAALFSWWLTRDILLSWIDPTDHKDAYVLTSDVILQSSGSVKLRLPSGTTLRGPCRHDLGYTEPFDPKIWKLYIHSDFSDFHSRCVPISEWTNDTIRGYNISTEEKDQRTTH